MTGDDRPSHEETKHEELSQADLAQVRSGVSPVPLSPLTDRIHQQAFNELAEGEKTATALENQLTAIEQKIDDLLARADQEQRALEEQSRTQESSQESTEDGT